ncbi:MAG: hypothetical protein M3Y09_12445 [Actinomycetota bacterium]|nr:hypothetical protein [Actinomycetota bacterium]
MRQLTLIALVSMSVAGFTVAGCGSSSSNSSAGGSAVSSSSSGTTHFAKTKFLLHAGLAFGAFHRYIYKPFRAGVFSHPFLHKLSLLKAGLAALFITHELKIAAVDVRSSKLLSRLFSPLTAVAAKLGALRSAITGGSVSASDIGGVQSQRSSIGSTASSHGQAIQDALPSAGQLASGG